MGALTTPACPPCVAGAAPRARSSWAFELQAAPGEGHIRPGCHPCIRSTHFNLKRSVHPPRLQLVGAQALSCTWDAATCTWDVSGPAEAAHEPTPCSLTPYSPVLVLLPPRPSTDAPLQPLSTLEEIQQELDQLPPNILLSKGEHSSRGSVGSAHLAQSSSSACRLPDPFVDITATVLAPIGLALTGVFMCVCVCVCVAIVVGNFGGHVFSAPSCLLCTFYFTVFKHPCFTSYRTHNPPLQAGSPPMLTRSHTKICLMCCGCWRAPAISSCPQLY